MEEEAPGINETPLQQVPTPNLSALTERVQNHDPMLLDSQRTMNEMEQSKELEKTELARAEEGFLPGPRGLEDSPLRNKNDPRDSRSRPGGR